MNVHHARRTGHAADHHSERLPLNCEPALQERAGIVDATGEPAYTGCVAFGLDRLAVAMFHTHDLATAKWPSDLPRMLGYAS